MPEQVKCLDDPKIIFDQNMCLNAVSKNLLRGDLKLRESKPQACDKPLCKTLKTLHFLRLPVRINEKCDSPLSRPLDGEIIVENLVTAFDRDGMRRGFHAGDFVWNGHGVTLVGRMSGMTNEGTHRQPVFEECQQCDEHGVMEGRLCGQVTSTEIPELKGCRVQAAYRLRFKPSRKGGEGPINGTLEGVIICQCKP